MTMDPVTHVEDVHKQHASVGTYRNIALILAVVTVIELLVPYARDYNIPLPDWFSLTILAVLSVFKFALVVMFFMHLYYDSRLMTFLFTIGLVMAFGTIMSTKALMHIKSLEKPEPIVTQKVELLPADPKRGMVVIEERACATCHHITEIAKARGTTGPNLDDIGDVAATRKPGMTAQAYIEESINTPLAYVVPGYPPSMPSAIRDTLTDQEYIDVVAYLLTLKKK